MIRKLTLALLMSGSVLTAQAPALAQTPAPVSKLVDAVNIPHEKFTLDNGLTVLVHEDRKAPIVAVSIWYGVGSKNEPKGKTGYAHLFEHIMFNGSENAPGDYFEYTKKIGATDLNGTTWLDRTNYFQTVPTTALESALFLESDRMGYLLNGLSKEKLDNQIGVVSNEKRQGDNQPFGLVDYTRSETLFPEGHPYHHDTIGSLEDLSAASLDDMKTWFTDHYGPNNAVLVLAGDINAAQAKPLVEKWFGKIKRGKDVAPVNAPVPTLEKDIKIVMKDKVPTTRIYRNWVVPGLADPDTNSLFVGLSALGGLSSSRLDNILVRQEQTAVGASAYLIPFVHGSLVNIQVDVKPGADADAVAKRLDQILADYIKTGPTAEEVQRVAASNIAAQIDGLEQVGGFGGKAVALAEGQLYVGDSDFYKKELQRLATAKPAAVKAAMQKWLTRPVLEIRVEPGEREVYKEVAAGSGGRTGTLSSPAFYAPPGSEDNLVSSPLSFQDRSTFPEPTGTPALDFPTVEETTLSNGIKVFFARRAAVPTVRVAVSFNAGYAADPADKRGIASMMSTMMSEGTTSLTSTQIAETEEKLGADVSVGSSLDRTVASLRAVKPNLGLSLDLLADVIKNPAFAANELERVRVQQLTRIKSENNQPQGIAVRRMPPLLYGKGHPYGGPQTGSGYAETVSAISRDDVVNFHTSWVHPAKAEIFVVGDTSLKEIKPMLEVRFGKWTSNAAPAPAKNFAVAVPAPVSRILLIDRPNAPQSLVLAGVVLDAKGSDDLLTLRAANEIFGGDFLSRINMDLRETKGWSYGVRSQVNGAEDRVPFYMFAPVQTNQTGPSVKVLIDQLKDFNGAKPVTAEELEKTIKGNVLELPGSYEQSSAVLGQMQSDRLNKRPFDYAETVAAKYTALTAKALNDEMRAKVDPSKITWLVVGDAAKVKPQLEALGLPIEMVTEAANTNASNSAK
ncbi:MAG: insulinase family protein [Sphingorhabdus sp.]|jgi:zinc protease|uniref:M16 family metallopeptidase n=1 Tax=Sphingorhabdus sp. TaxID=1902408 RepID=UPI00273E94ED|nr:pitrilysin family protein [Sphingorhabdus sp.]MDP4757425.1 insulinase family protein [Sphingorhabdus sp.]MDP4872663.1 insulinase family protein [Sphingorhabdus sp.]MDP4927508.1 insulinase family protein [Sphingorhabdus sp.]